METPIIVAIVGILGVVAGASLQFFFGKQIEASKQFKMLQTQAYVDFLRRVAGVAKAQQFGDKEKELEYITLVSDSKTRISIYGSLKVAKKLAEFFREHSETTSVEGAKSYCELIQTMREESLGVESDLSMREVEEILFAGPKNEKIK